ncbi:MAG: hypothetical protein NTW79_04085 [Candidatus Berkelbacteria bacterium]|nr:hypothetical protein [Candidatus Berkelbacteria bacterium]
MSRQETKEKIKSITMEILEALDTFMGALLFSAGSAHQFHKQLYKRRPDIDRDTFYHHLYSMNQRKLINYDHTSDSVKFTNKGLMKIAEKVCSRYDTDEIFRFVSFDIPEKLKSFRDQFRSALKRLGFRHVQKSLWVINRDVSQMVEIAALECQVEKYFTYIVATSSDIDGILVKMFKQ